MADKTQILVTGAAGFIGWNLTRELRSLHGDRAIITGVDNLWTGRRRKQEFVDTMVVHDCETFWNGQQFDEVWHLASPASPNHYQSDPIRTAMGNVRGMLRALELTKNCGSLLFTSTSEVYGDPIVSPQHEGYLGQVNCIGPRACYDESKRLSETLIFDWLRSHRHIPGFSMRAKVARLFNVYGPGTLPDDGRAVSNFITAALGGELVTVFGDGKQTRCFTYVDDVVGGLMRLMYQTPASFCGPMNLGTDRETSVSEIARFVAWRVGEILRREIPVVHGPPVIDDPQQRRPDLALARRSIGWDPVVSYEAGISRTIDWFRIATKEGI